jgi:hypothetical protein
LHDDDVDIDVASAVLKLDPTDGNGRVPLENPGGGPEIKLVSTYIEAPRDQLHSTRQQRHSHAQHMMRSTFHRLTETMPVGFDKVE